MPKFLPNILSGKTPRFWKSDGFLPQLLVPISVLYFIAKRIASKKIEPQKFPAKIICVGNATAGGAGKTPTAIAIAQTILSQSPKAKICFVSKGYKGLITKPTLVNLAEHNYTQTGDEPLILAQYAQTIVAKDRLEGINFAIEQGAEIIILDDGLHDKRVSKDK